MEYDSPICPFKKVANFVGHHLRPLPMTWLYGLGYLMPVKTVGALAWKWVHSLGVPEEAMAACGGVHLNIERTREEETGSIPIQWIEPPAEEVSGSLTNKPSPPVLLPSRETLSLNSANAIERERLSLIPILIQIFTRLVCHEWCSLPVVCFVGENIRKFDQVEV